MKSVYVERLHRVRVLAVGAAVDQTGESPWP